MKIKTKDLIGAALDWAVATALSRGPTYNHEGFGTVFKGWWLTKGGEYREMPFYSTDWKHGGIIIEQNDISFRKYHRPDSSAHGTYYAKVCRESGALIQWSNKLDSTGPTPLIAAMRCFVARKLGDEIEIPEELC